MEIHWFIPGHGDSRFLSTSISKRQTSFAYLAQVVQAIDSLGYSGALLPTGQTCEDPWVLAAALMPLTRQMKFLVAVRPGIIDPKLVADMSATFDQLSNGRLLLNIVTGGDPVELAGEGTHLGHDERYAVTHEFLQLYRRLFTEQAVDFSGQYFDVKAEKQLLKSVQAPYPPLYFGGSSAAGHRVAAQHADVYLTLAEPPAEVAAKIADVRAQAAAYGRTIRVGVRVHIIVRENENDAWSAAEDLLRYVDQSTIEATQTKLARFDSTGQNRMRNLHTTVNKYDRSALEISPNLWSGFGLVNKGLGTALVGDPQTVAARLQEYADLGVDNFVLSSYPHLEEAYRVAELVFPLLPAWREKYRIADQVYRR